MFLIKIVCAMVSQKNILIPVIKSFDNLKIEDEVIFGNYSIMGISVTITM